MSDESLTLAQQLLAPTEEAPPEEPAALDVPPEELAAHVGVREVWKAAKSPPVPTLPLASLDEVPSLVSQMLSAEDESSSTVLSDPTAVLDRAEAGIERFERAERLEKPKKRDASDETEAGRRSRLKELAEEASAVAADPEASLANARSRSPWLPPLAGKAAVVVARTLADAYPKAPGPDPLNEFMPSDKDLSRFDGLQRAVLDPASVLERLDVASPEEVAAVRDNYPARWTRMQEALRQRVASEGTEGVSREVLVQVLGPEFERPVPRLPPPAQRSGGSAGAQSRSGRRYAEANALETARRPPPRGQE